MVIQHLSCGVKIVVIFLGILQLTESLFIAAPRNVTVYNKTSTSLQIYWEAVNGTILGYRIRHQMESMGDFIDNNSSLYNNSSLFVCKNQTSTLLQDLEVYTDYWVEVRAFNNGTFGNNGTSKVFRTDEEVPTSPPLNITTSKENSTSITVSWGSVPKEHQRGKIIGYVVKITEYRDTSWYIGFNVSSNLVTIVGLEKFTRYNVTVSSRTSKGVSNASVVYTIRTEEDAPDGSPTNITIRPKYNIRSNYIIVRWRPVERRSLNGILRAYKLRWKQVTQIDYFEKTINFTSSHSRRKRSVEHSNVTGTQLTNLSIYTNYSLEVAAVTVKVGKYSDPVFFLSPEGVPTSPPGDVTAYNTSSTTINVTWSRPEENTIQGKLLGYEITYTPAPKNASSTRRVMVCYRHTSFELTNLTIYTLYNITVAAFTRVGIGKESELKQTWSDEEKPDAAPQNVTAVPKTFSSIQVSWDPVPADKRNGIITKYEVYVSGYVNGSDYKKYILTENRTVEIPGLEMFILYTVAVRAYTRIGPGPAQYSKSSITTLETAPSVVPSNVSSHATSRTTVHVTWDIDKLEPGFKLRRYVISYRELEHATIWNNMTVDDVSVAISFSNFFLGKKADLTGLLTFTTYEIKVAASTNFIGKYSKPVNVTTNEGVPQGYPVNVSAVPDTVSNIRVSWYPVPEEERKGNISHYNVRVTNSSDVRNFTTDSLTAIISDLDMYVTYYFEVQAFTSAGPGNFSPIVNATTKQTAPDVDLEVTTSATSNSSITVTWNIVTLHHQLEVNGYRIKHCAWRYDESNVQRFDHCLSNPCNETNVTHYDSTGYTIELSDLRIYTTYQIQVQATHITALDLTMVKIPHGSYSKAINETTHEGAPNGPPLNVQAKPHSTTSIIVQWGQVDECKRNGEIINYMVEVYNSSLAALPFKVVNGTTYQVIFSNLQYANYSAKVQAVTAAGEGPYSAYQNTTPHQSAPSIVPGNVSAVATGNSTIRVKWSATGIPSNMGFQGFTIKYEAVEHPKFNGDDTVNGIIYEKTLTGLRMSTKYNIRVAARTTQDGNYSETVTATTWEGVPTAPPSNIDANILDSTLVGISWGPVPEEERNGEIQGYRVIYYRADNDTYRSTIPVKGQDFHSVQLRSLGKFSQYNVKVLAFTKVGNGVAGDITFRTSDDVPSKAPGKLKAYSKISPHKISVSWEPVPTKFMNGELISYLVTYQRVRIGDVIKEYEPKKKAIVGKDLTSVMLGNLEPYSKYKITIAAKTAKGFGPNALFVYGETCHCEKRLTTSWRRYEPYVNFTEDGQPGQIIPIVLQAMVKECCGQCSEHNQTILDFKTNGRNRPSARNTSRALLEHMDEHTDFTFPVYGHKDQDTYKGGYGYTPVIESAGVAFIVYPEVLTTQTTMFKSLIRCLPVLLLPIVTAYIAGVIIWCLERRNNPDDFPQSFLLGTWEGVWWSFVSMTTLGYGDRAPLSYKGRIFAILWILFGLVVIAITMAMLTTALTSITLKSEPKLYGSKIAAEFNSPEYNVGTRRNAIFDPDKEYHSIEEVADALINKDVEGVLVDTYSAGLRGDLFNRPTIRVSKVLDYKTAYGVVLSPNSTRLGKCFHRYMLSNRADIFEMIEKNAKPIKTSSSSDESVQEEASGGLLDSSSPVFLKALRYACVCLGIALGLSLVYECIRRIRERQKVHQVVHLKEILQKEMQSLVEEFTLRMKETKIQLREKHLKQIITYWKLKRKSMTANGNEGEWLRISMASPHKGDLAITDMEMTY